MFPFPEITDFPKRVIITDEPMRSKMLVAHHLENAATIQENGKAHIYTGSYGGIPIAIISPGFECDRNNADNTILDYLYECKKLGVTEIIYIGVCASATSETPLRTVIIADGNHHGLNAAAARVLKKLAISAISFPAPALNDRITDKLYARALEYNISILSVLTVSQNLETGEYMEEHERLSRLNIASRLAFEILVFT